MILNIVGIFGVTAVAILTRNAVFWLVAGGMAIFTGFYWPETYGNTDFDYATGLIMWAYGIVCFGVAMVAMFTRIRDRAGWDRGD